MNLWLVTWDLGLTQFLVEAKTESEAIYKAIEVNKKIELSEYDPNMDVPIGRHFHIAEYILDGSG